MIRNLLATTALATLVATAAYAQQNAAPAPDRHDPARRDDRASSRSRS